MLDKLPPEILDRILLKSDPIDLASLAQVSRALHYHIYGSPNRLRLWYLIFLNYFDDPLSNEPIRSIFLNHRSTIKIAPHDPAVAPDSFSIDELISSIDWFKTLIPRITLRQSLATNDEELLQAQLLKHYPDAKLDDLYDLIFLLINTAHPSSALFPSLSNLTSNSSRHQRSLNLRFLQAMLSNPPAQFRLVHYSGLNCQHQPVYALRDSRDDPRVVAAAKLHTYYGLTSFDLGRSRTRGIARESCYALVNYTANNLYGPFIPDRSCRVDWPHLEALSLVVSLNLYNIFKEAQKLEATSSETLAELPNLPVDPPPFTMPNTAEFIRDDDPILRQDGMDEPENLSQSPSTRLNRKPERIHWPILEGLFSAYPSTQLMHPTYDHPAYPWPPSNHPSYPTDLNHYDWAGVTGKWLRVVCFLDYRDLHAYNFDQRSPPRLDDHTEAVRSMTLDLKVVSIGVKPNTDQEFPIGLIESEDRPPVYFTGMSAYNVGISSVPISGQSPSSVRGCVSMTADGEVRWSMISTLVGADRWSSEGIQVGGVRSRWGVLGAWSDADRNEIEGPVGPFYFFKASY